MRKVKGYDRMGEYLDLDEGMGTGNATADILLSKTEEEQRYRDLVQDQKQIFHLMI